MGNCAIAGRFYLTIGGKQISARGAFDIQPLNYEREGEANQDGTIFVSEKAVPAEASGSLSYSRDLNLETLYQICGVPATIELVNGDTFVFPAAMVVGTPKLNTEKGEISDFKIISQTCRRVLGA
ncbi:phage tail tube protein [Paraburkholderia tuberum]|uniref:Phage tail tube protein n=1 Tax=Paraburkholderia tuberum TaxID=157910 RepID=A0A1H1JSM6_9BURK|nr:phage tail tube protein [Paraburkholderia tuberum]SDR52912.1 Phage tail tube protein [Paraburkholderia tuberum]